MLPVLPRPFSVKTRFPSSIKQIIIPLSFRCLKRLISLNICARFVISKLFIKEVLLNLFVCFDLVLERWDSTLFQICFKYKIRQVQRTDPLTPLVLSRGALDFCIRSILPRHLLLLLLLVLVLVLLLLLLLLLGYRFFLRYLV